VVLDGADGAVDDADRGIIGTTRRMNTRELSLTSINRLSAFKDHDKSRKAPYYVPFDLSNAGSTNENQI
jgi:hypothetical protein